MHCSGVAGFSLQRGALQFHGSMKAMSHTQTLLMQSSILRTQTTAAPSTPGTPANEKAQLAKQLGIAADDFDKHVQDYKAHKLDSNNQVTKTKEWEVPSPLRPAKTFHVILDHEQQTRIENGLDEEDDLRAIMADADDRLAAELEANRRKKFKASKQEARERARAEGRRSPARKDEMYLDMRHKHTVISRAEMKKSHFCVAVYRPQDDDNEEVRAACKVQTRFRGFQARKQFAKDKHVMAQKNNERGRVSLSSRKLKRGRKYRSGAPKPGSRGFGGASRKMRLR